MNKKNCFFPPVLFFLCLFLGTTDPCAAQQTIPDVKQEHKQVHLKTVQTSTDSDDEKPALAKIQPKPNELDKLYVPDGNRLFIAKPEPVPAEFED